MTTTTRYTTRSGSVYAVRRGVDGTGTQGTWVRRERLGDHHRGDRRDHRVAVDRVEEYRRVLAVRACNCPDPACPDRAPRVGGRLVLDFGGDDVLYTSAVTAIEGEP